MSKRIAQRVGIMSTAAVATFLVAAGSAAADPPQTPNGWEGACNMMQSWPGLRQNPQGVGVPPGGAGMAHAMTVDNPNGNDGMSGATERTSADDPNCEGDG